MYKTEQHQRGEVNGKWKHDETQRNVYFFFFVAYGRKISDAATEKAAHFMYTITGETHGITSCHI